LPPALAVSSLSLSLKIPCKSFVDLLLH
jgi:hypothetical protein